MFNMKSKDEVDSVLKRTQRFSGAIQQLRDSSTPVLNQMWSKSEQAMARAVKKHMKEINTHRDVPDRGIDQVLDSTYKNKNINPIDEFEVNESELTQFNDYMLHDPITDEFDPIVIKAAAHDQTLADMKEELVLALNERKGKVLTSALKIFNKV